MRPNEHSKMSQKQNSRKDSMDDGAITDLKTANPYLLAKS